MYMKRFMEKPNPRHAAFVTMKLYLYKQVRERSWLKFGGEEGLETEKRKREKTRWDETLKKTKGVFTRDEATD